MKVEWCSNGSDLGKGYSGQAITKQFDTQFKPFEREQMSYYNQRIERLLGRRKAHFAVIQMLRTHF